MPATNNVVDDENGVGTFTSLPYGTNLQPIQTQQQQPRGSL